MELLPIIVILGIAGVGFCLMLAAFIMIARRGGWERAMQPDAEGHWPLPRKLMLAGAALGCLFGLLMLLAPLVPGVVPWWDRSSASGAAVPINLADGLILVLVVLAYCLLVQTNSSVVRLERKLDALLKHSGLDLAAAAAREAEALVRAGRKAEAIKLYREYTGVGLAQAKAAIERLQQSA
jgi:hypothetical protein